MQQFDSLITTNRKIAESYYYMELSWPIDDIPSPGQFMTLRISDDSSPLLRRPFAFSGYDSDRKICSIIYQKRGRGTELLIGKQPGDKINVIGPLGKSFPIPHQKGKQILVGGGIGIGPILFLASQLKELQLESTFIFGCRSRHFIPDLQNFKAFNPVICTDDGSEGFNGTTGDYLLSIEEKITSNDTIYCCGPHPMMKACHEIAEKHSAACWVSVEQIMACGVGACMGCAVKIVNPPGYARACKEGPVFLSSELLWN